MERFAEAAREEGLEFAGLTRLGEKEATGQEA